MTNRWVELAGAANVRDLGGLPTRDGAATQFKRIIRADNLQGLTVEDVEQLVGLLGVRDIIDLRTGIEVELEGPGPMTTVADVTIHHLSLFTEAGERTDVEAADDVLLPWQAESTAERPETWDATGLYYTHYLFRRPDSVLAALRTMAQSSGATVTHCAAGKDRTGVICAMALAVVNVEPDAIVADYVASGERLPAVLARLKASDTYAADLDGSSVDHHRPRPETMQTFLGYLDDEFGGPIAWLERHGWTSADTDAMRTHLVN